MVDLHQSLRPAETTPPLPISELATRSARRRRRRVASVTGVAIAALGLASFAIANMQGSPDVAVTVADGTADRSVGPVEIRADDEPVPPSDPPPTSPPDSDSTTTDSADEPTSTVEAEVEVEPSTTSSERSATTPPQTGSIPANHPMTTPDIQSSATTTSAWDDGYCIQVEVTNGGTDPVSWQLAIDLGGIASTVWNATAVETTAGTFVFAGQEGYNAIIEPGAGASFGTCVDTG